MPIMLDCRYAECRYAECRYAECCGVLLVNENWFYETFNQIRFQKFEFLEY